MYNDWQLINVGQLFDENRWSVVHKLPNINGQNVVNEVVKPLAVSLNNNNQSVVCNFPANSINSSNNLNSTLISNTAHHRDDESRDEFHLPNSSSSNNAASNDNTSDYTCYLKTDRDVHWVMEVICYGLGLPISTTEHYETVRDCVQIYCEWIYALTVNKSQTKLIPFPIRDDPNHYFRRMLQHLYNIFVPRISSIYTLHNISNNTELSMTDIISKQALLCHRVLRTISTIAEDEANLMDGESWDNLLLFLLAVNDELLSLPGEREDIGTHLCERVITVLFEIWIVACKRCFPTPSYWKTLQHLFSTWRHRPQVIEQWSNVCLVFTQRLVQLNNQMTFSNLQQQQEQCLYESLDNMELSQVLPNSSNYSNYINQLIQQMDYVIVSQSWYRFLMIINNPVDLSSPDIISRTKKFTSFATECVVDPRQHPCLDNLPQNFFKAMKGCAQLVDTFLSINNLTSSQTAAGDTVDATNSHTNNRSLSGVDGSSLSNLSIDKTSSNIVTPPNSRKFTKNLGKHAILSGLHSVNKPAAQSNISQTSSNYNFSSTGQQHGTPTVPFCVQTYLAKPIKYSIYRPKINSILKIFGNWLFNAALISNELSPETNELENSGSISSFNSLSNQTASYNTATNEMMNRRNSNDRVSIEMSLALQPENFEAGIAEAIGALCRLFSSKQTDEEIAPIYYARFFEALKLGLSTTRKEPICSQILSSILINGTQLFRLNLSGIDILIPDFFKAIELFMIEKEQTKFKFTANSLIELRRACIKIMLSLLSYPLHFNELPIKDCLTDEQSCTVFRSLKPQLVSLMLNAFHSEKDSLNLQMILGGFITLLEDTYRAGEETKILGTVDNASTNVTNQTKDTIPDDAKSLYTVVLSSVCHLLINQKKNDTQVSLAALEVLSEMARIHLADRNVDESKKATDCVCDYIVTQCSRPPPHHSKDMHSTLVAAYQCLAIWFSEHPYLLKDNFCLNTLIEVIELGISGSKSTVNNEAFKTSSAQQQYQDSSSKSIVFKTFKELKPASMRVRESAEFLLDCLMNQFGCTPQAPCPPECVTGCCDLNEQSLLQLVNENQSPSLQSPTADQKKELTLEEACKRFKYFISENAILIGFLNNPKNQSAYCLIRSPFGKFCWEMHFQLKADSSEVHSDFVDVARPISCLSHKPKNLPIPKNFPSSVSRVALSNIENSIPSLKQVINKCPASQQQHLNQMFKIVEQQKKSEQNLKHRCMSDLKNRHFDCKKPKSPPISDLDCARLIVNHLGLMNAEKNHNLSSLSTAQLVHLDATHLELFSNIINLDSLPLRTCDTAFIYYVRKGRIHPQEILNSVCSFNYVKPAFLEFLSSLGTPINCKQHYGWTGNLYTSWKGNFNQEGDAYSYHHYAEHGGAIYDGQKMSIYWADVSHEMAFIVPSRGLESGSFENDKPVNNSNHNNGSACNQSQSTTVNSSLSFEDKKNSSEQRSMSSYSDNDTISSASHNLSENSSQLKANTASIMSNTNSLTNNDLTQRKKSRQPMHTNIGCDIKILIIWLENSEDEYSLPLNTLMQTTNTGAEKCKIQDYIAILIHPLKNGLFSIKIISSQEKIPLALPLLDGIVVSKRILGLFIRLTTLNIYKRRRLDMDSFQMPHCKRRQKIQEISKKHRLSGKDVEFFNSLF